MPKRSRRSKVPTGHHSTCDAQERALEALRKIKALLTALNEHLPEKAGQYGAEGEFEGRQLSLQVQPDGLSYLSFCGSRRWPYFSRKATSSNGLRFFFLPVSFLVG